MGTENVSTDPNSPYNPNNPGADHRGIRGISAGVVGRANAARIGENINDYVKKDNARLAGIADRQRNQAALRADYQTNFDRSRATNNTPVFRPGQQVFK